MTKRLLVLGAGPAQLGLLAAARRRGLFVIAVDRDPRAPGFDYADRRAILSSEDEPGIEQLARAERVDGLIAPGIDWPVAIAARVAARLGLSHPLDPQTAILATSKLAQRKCFDERQVPQPRWDVVSEPADAFRLPAVVKAPDRQGQRGLSVVREPSGLWPAMVLALSESRSGTALVEELIEGPEVTVNAFSLGGEFHALTVTDRLTARKAFGVALAHVHPSELDVTGAVDVARRATAALGVTEGPTYTQIRLGPEGPRVVELAARLGGGHDAELCEAALGVSLNELAIAAALGEEIDAAELRPSECERGACVRFLVAPPGELRRVDGVEEAERLVEWVRLYREPGYRFGPLRTGPDRAGALLAVGFDRDDAFARGDRAASLVRFETVDAEALV